MLCDRAQEILHLTQGGERCVHTGIVWFSLIPRPLITTWYKAEAAVLTYFCMCSNLLFLNAKLIHK